MLSVIFRRGTSRKINPKLTKIELFTKNSSEIKNHKKEKIKNVTKTRKDLFILNAKKRTNKELIKALHHQKEALISTGQITRPEAVTEMNLKNALKSLQEDGVLISDKKERLEVDREHLKTVMTWLNPMVNE